VIAFFNVQLKYFKTPAYIITKIQRNTELKLLCAEGMLGMRRRQDVQDNWKTVAIDCCHA